MFLRKKKALSALIASTMVASVVPFVEIRPAAMVSSLVFPHVVSSAFSWMWENKGKTAAGAGIVLCASNAISRKYGKNLLNRGIPTALGLGDYAFVIGSNKWQLIKNAVEIRCGGETNLHADWRHLVYLAKELNDEEVMGEKKCYSYFTECESRGHKATNPDFTRDATSLLQQLVKQYNDRNEDPANQLVFNLKKPN